MKTLRTLNDKGISVFTGWLANPSDIAPRQVLFDPEFSESLESSYFIDPDRHFATTFEIGAYLYNEVFQKSNDRFGIRSMNGVWAWVSLAYIDSLMSHRSKSRPRPLASPHYVDAGSRLSYRLIVRTAWELYLLHGDACRVALSSRSSPWGEMSEQMTGATQENFSHRAFWALANHLYLDESGIVRRGAASKRPKSAKLNPRSDAGKGSVRRLAKTMNQFERTYNTRDMTIGELIAVLPSEYSKWAARPLVIA